ncbi:hypothetical protein ABS71_05510 [bacterium SCN 62-11]|nr:hypothetical protein [Candidatus Eremiobacteraeota bacterium]ODT74565.1 MAG: hypothetical protein ABS71_05510 [bacterium SCN 62-11]
MGAPNPSFQKRAKEQKRKEKAEAKRANREAKKQGRGDDETPEIPLEDIPALNAPGSEPPSDDD